MSNNEYSITSIITMFYDYFHVSVLFLLRVVLLFLLLLLLLLLSLRTLGLFVLLPGSRRMPWMEDRGVDELLGQPSGFVEWSEKLQWL